MQILAYWADGHVAAHARPSAAAGQVGPEETALQRQIT